APGVIDTDMYRMLGPETMSLVLDDIPVGRIGTPADVVRAVLFLADDGAGFITGQVLGVNGGMVI
ncbi:MAG: SDR family oxidoreductase, partial [Butyricicoccaceae bacterium]